MHARFWINLFTFLLSFPPSLPPPRPQPLLRPGLPRSPGRPPPPPPGHAQRLRAVNDHVVHDGPVLLLLPGQQPLHQVRGPGRRRAPQPPLQGRGVQGTFMAPSLPSSLPPSFPPFLLGEHRDITCSFPLLFPGHTHNLTLPLFLALPPSLPPRSASSPSGWWLPPSGARARTWWRSAGGCSSSSTSSSWLSSSATSASASRTSTRNRYVRVCPPSLPPSLPPLLSVITTKPLVLNSPLPPSRPPSLPPTDH